MRGPRWPRAHVPEGRWPLAVAVRRDSSHAGLLRRGPCGSRPAGPSGSPGMAAQPGSGGGGKSGRTRLLLARLGLLGRWRQAGDGSGLGVDAQQDERILLIRRA